MALKLRIGQYWRARSPIHELDPRLKVVVALALMLAVFFVRTPVQLVIGIASMLVVVMLARIPASKVLQSIQPVVFVLVVLSVFNLVFTQTGTVLASWGPLRITDNGLRAAYIYSLRLIIGVLAGLILLLTTTPMQLSDAFDSLLAPLAIFHVPAHEIAMVFSLMLRFIPTLADEATAIIDAQTARGGSLSEGSLAQRLHSIVALVVSLLASSVHHAHNLSRALDARAYNSAQTRSHWHEQRFGARDVLAALISLVCIVCLVLAGRF